MAACFTWSYETTLSLITLYENYTCLWDVKSEDYHNKVQRNSAINEIAKHIGTTDREVTNKIKSLRSQYAREKAKYVAEARRSGSGLDGVIQIKWTHFKALKFLDSTINARSSKSNIEALDTDSIETLVEDRLPRLQMLPLTEESLLPENEEEESGEEAIQLQQSSTKKPVSAKKCKRAPNNNDEMLQKAVSYLGTASEHISKRREEREPDEEEIFSKYIANELRQISDGHIKRVAKHKIENILFEAHCSSMDASFPQKGQFLS